MGIKLLSKDVINQISAGEVVEKPASIVKELVENSIDAGAKNITIEISGGGISKICVIDDGCGINKNEVELAFTPHATSKLVTIEDLNQIATKGFRGEALATISAVSKVCMVTKTENDDTGIRVELLGGEEVLREEVACTTGTKIEVLDVFYNTPARLKFLRKPKTEEADITTYVEKLILSNSEISFKYIVDGKIKYNTINCDTVNNIYTIYGKEVADNIIKVDYSIGNYKLFGYISKPEFGRANRTYQTLFVNNRFCNNALVSSAVSTAYENFAMKGKFPLYILFLSLPQNELDVNVHPSKLEVKFADTRKVYQLCIDAVFKALSDFNHIKRVEEVKEPEEINIEYASLTKEEGVSFKGPNLDEELFRDNYVNEIIDNNKNNGAMSFNLTGSLLQEVALSEADNAEEKKEAVKVEQTSYSNLFDADYKYVGKIFNTYLIIEQDDKVYLIDQHAAHEREKYDSLMKQLEDNNVLVQNVLVPYTFDVSPSEYGFILENMKLLNSFGFAIDEFGNNSFKISAVPVLLADINFKQFISEILQNINSYVKSPKELIKEKFMQMACKAAVKGGDDLKEQEIKYILDTLKNKTQVLLCPHGRPIIIELDKKQIEKWFKRIV